MMSVLTTELLADRRSEIEQAVLTRIAGLPTSPAAAEDPRYSQGTRDAVAAALSYALETLECSRFRSAPVPADLLSQARLAAASDVPLDAVIRRYLAGYAVVEEQILLGPSFSDSADVASLCRALLTVSAAFDQVIAAVAAEYRAEYEARTNNTRDRRRSEYVRQVLSGQLSNMAQLNYNFDVWHMAAVFSGKDAEITLRRLAQRLDRQLLFLQRTPELFWAWFGGHRRLKTDCVERLVTSSSAVVTGYLALGEPGEGIRGWRQSHRQAAAASLVAERVREGTVIRYASVPLLASALQDETLTESLKKLYLNPLTADSDGMTALCPTLNAYFAAGRNVSSTAAALGITRKTVGNRLQRIERHLGCSLDACSAEMELALQLEDLKAYGRIT